MSPTFEAIKPFLTNHMQGTRAIALASGLPLDAVVEALRWARLRGLVAFDHWFGAADWFYAKGSQA